MDWITLNSFADSWSWFMLDRLISASILCMVVSVVYFRFKKLISPSMGILLYSLVLIKCVIPVQPYSLFTWNQPASEVAAIPSTHKQNVISTKLPNNISNTTETEIESQTNSTRHINTNHNNEPYEADETYEVMNQTTVSSLQTMEQSTPLKTNPYKPNPETVEPAYQPEIIVAKVKPDHPTPYSNQHNAVFSIGSADTKPVPKQQINIPTVTLPPLSWTSYLLFTWTVGVLLLFIRWMVFEWKAYRLIRTAKPIAKESLPVAWHTIQRASGVKSEVSLQTAEWVSSPFATGILKPSIFLPQSYQTQYSKQDLQWILLHELAHVRRCDPLMQLCQSIIQTVFYFHPAVWFANRMIYRLREFACDEAAVHGSNSSRTDCGEGLLRIVLHANTQMPQLSGAVNMVHSKQLIKERLMRILHPHPSINRITYVLSAMFIITMMYFMPVGIIQPQAQDSSEEIREKATQLQQEEQKLLESNPQYQKDIDINEEIVINEKKQLIRKEKQLKRNDKELLEKEKQLLHKSNQLRKVNIDQEDIDIQLHQEEIQNHIKAVQDMLHEMEIEYDFDFDFEHLHEDINENINRNINSVPHPVPHPNVHAIAQVNTNINIHHDTNDDHSEHFNMHINQDDFFETNEPGQIRGVWTGNVHEDLLNVEYTYKFDDGKIESGRTYKNYQNQFPALSQLTESSPNYTVSFSIKKDAGEIIFNGSFDRGLGTGQFTFEQNPTFTKVYNTLGYGDITNRRQFFYTMHDLKLSFIEYLKNSGYPNLTEDELFEFCIFGVDEEYIEGMKALGFTDLPVKKFIEMKIHGVTPEYIKYFRDAGFTEQEPHDYVQMKIHGLTPKAYEGYVNAGYTDLDVKELMKLCIHGVSPEYIQTIKDAGYDNIPINKYVEMKIHNVSTDFIKKMADNGFTNLSVNELVNMRIHNVRPEMANSLVELGFEKPSANKLAELSIHGVNEQYIHEIAALGYQDISLNKLVEFKIHGVKPKRIKQFQELGYKDISASQIVEMQIHGITPDFAKKMNDEAGEQLTIKEIINKRMHR